MSLSGFFHIFLAVLLSFASLLSGCVSMPETEEELLAGRREAAMLEGRDESEIRLEPPQRFHKKSLSLEEIYRELEFNPDGRGIHFVAFFDPEATYYASRLKDEAVKKVAELFPNVVAVDNEADAFRHAYFSFRLADKVGSARAKKFTDAYEISNINTMGARCMDLWNNREGRRMCEESANSKEPDRRAQAERIVLDAVKSNRLILSPFRLQNAK